MDCENFRYMWNINTNTQVHVHTHTCDFKQKFTLFLNKESNKDKELNNKTINLFLKIQSLDLTHLQCITLKLTRVCLIYSKLLVATLGICLLPGDLIQHQGCCVSHFAFLFLSSGFFINSFVISYFSMPSYRSKL